MNLHDIKGRVAAHLKSKGGPAEAGEPMHAGEMLHHALKMKDQATSPEHHAAAHEAIVEAVKAAYHHGK